MPILEANERNSVSAHLPGSPGEYAAPLCEAMQLPWIQSTKGVEPSYLGKYKREGLVIAPDGEPWIQASNSYGLDTEVAPNHRLPN